MRRRGAREERITVIIHGLTYPACVLVRELVARNRSENTVLCLQRAASDVNVPLSKEARAESCIKSTYAIPLMSSALKRPGKQLDDSTPFGIYLHDSSCHRRGVFYSPKVAYGADSVPRSIHDHGIQRHFSGAVRVATVPFVKENGKGLGRVT